MKQRDKKGYVYILVNPAFSGFAKVGKTTKDPEVRARELSSGSGVPAPYAVAWDALVTDCDLVERLIHEKLAHKRARNDREFFAIPLKMAISVASTIVGPFCCEIAEQIENDSSHVELVKHYYRSAPRQKLAEELIMVAEDSVVDRAVVPGPKKTIPRITYEVLIENPYKYTEEDLRHEVHVVRRNKSGLKLGSYNIKRSLLLQKFGWGIHRNKQGKMALIPVESAKYQELLGSINTTKSYRASKVKKPGQGITRM